MVAESKISVDDLIQPIFIKENLTGHEGIDSMPGINRLGSNVIEEEIKKISDSGIKAVAVFPVVDEKKKNKEGQEALNENNFLNISISKIKESFPDLIVIADVALDPYTDHGHDGVLGKDNDVDNDLTLNALEKQALGLAKAGADVIAPSDMMDGRIGKIRKELDKNKFEDVQIISYAVKYASSFYGPFRDAVGSKGALRGDKKTYQMDFKNTNEALREVSIDIK